ncbi:MAG: GNAT family N-acetyltransferase [Alphaproteobacteria bacterium]|nr:GNAT family N-acetyltransferase [Alphaproteobacteria bacterium]
MDVSEYHDALNRNHFDLLLEADPSLDMVLAYTPPQLAAAEVFIIGKAKDPYAMCVVIPIKGGFEIKNIATKTIMRRQGMASALISHVAELARSRGAEFVEIGTASVSHDQIRLYQKLGFKRDGILRDFFLRYPEPIIENGQLARDMVMLRMNLSPSS